MRAVAQRVFEASVTVEGRLVGKIGRGLVVFLGVGEGDAEKDADYLAEKIAGLRIFPDADGKMNVSVKDVGGGVLMISQFTLYGDCRKGKRPSFVQAAEATEANRLYEYCVGRIKALGVETATGEFQAMMEVNVRNDGPVTILLDSKKEF
ncbi:MAG: D-tyrosyl-tRNA(Tyr) deacylase [Planctomycetes bacterium]|nr:D-tyrosyl-tRNA(Tyr) deacylase [Planctomycetota bacterium]